MVPVERDEGRDYNVYLHPLEQERLAHYLEKNAVLFLDLLRTAMLKVISFTEHGAISQEKDFCRLSMF